MNYVKKMCILRQIRQGFSGDGRALTGLIKIEQYGKNLAVEVSIINFAPLTSGEYYCLIADEKGRTELLPLRGKSLFNVVTDLQTEAGFCGVICFVKNGIFPIAYGTNGDHVYDWRTLLNDAVGVTTPPERHFAFADETAERIEKTDESKGEKQAETAQNPPPMYLTNEENAENGDTAIEKTPDINSVSDCEATEQILEENTAQNKNYDDELVAANNYYKDDEDERRELEKDIENAPPESGSQTQNEKIGANFAENEDDENVLAPFAKDPDGYYLSVKSEIDELFEKFPKDDTLKTTFAASEWVRVEKNGEYQLVGVIYKDWKAQYICYALPTATPQNPPEEIAEICTFVPISPFDTEKGHFVIFQSAATGECIKPQNS